jgi:hypothetical protein
MKTTFLIFCLCMKINSTQIDELRELDTVRNNQANQNNQSPTNSQPNYGTVGNSNLNTQTTPAQTQSQCLELTADSNACTKNIPCCFVSSSYYSYDYNGCVDIKNVENAAQFCSDFYALNAKNNYVAKACYCYSPTGVKIYNSSSFIYVSALGLLVTLISLF